MSAPGPTSISCSRSPTPSRRKGGEPHSDSSRNLEVDAGWLNFLTGLFLIVLPPLGIVFLIERIIVATRDAPDAGSGAGGGVPALIPQEILIPGGKKVVAFYERLEVFPGAVVAGGVFDVIPRTPEVSITGPTDIAVEEGSASVTRNYTLHTKDLRPPFETVLSPVAASLVPGPVAPHPKIVWSGDGVPLSPSAETTAFRFNLAGAQVGQVLTRRVSVLVVDSDGLSASADLFVRIHVTSADMNGDPPICRIKPWLPQCKGLRDGVTASRLEALTVPANPT